jgi:hypothetical protein
MSADKTTAPPTTNPPTTSTSSQSPFYRSPGRAHTLDELTEQLSESKVDHAKDGPMDDLASAFEEKWSPNSTRAEVAPRFAWLKEGEGKKQAAQQGPQSMTLQLRAKQDDTAAKK